ncbi:MAG: DUF3943 domain-containing protein [Myxococcota bacterium]
MKLFFATLICAMSLAAASTTSAQSPPSEQPQSTQRPESAEPAAAASPDVTPDDFYITPDGELVDASEAMEWSREVRDGPVTWWRALLEDGILIGSGTLWYVLNTSVNSQDFDLQAGPETIWKKITDLDQVRFDNNTFLFNNGWHALTSLGYYHFPRANNFGVWSSLGIAFAYSTAWEYAFEIREKVSINDQIVTTVAGLALGEVTYQLGEYFNSPQSRGNTAGRILTGLFGSPRLLHRWMDDELEDPLAESYEPYGGDIWHRFSAWGAYDFRAGPAERGETTTRNNGSLGVSTRMVVLPGYLRPGDYSTWFFDGRMTNMDFEIGFGPRGFEHIEIFAEAGVLGYHTQDIDYDGEHRDGSAVSFTLNNAYRVVHQNHDFWEDQRGIVHLLGPGVRLVEFQDGLKMEADLNAYVDFAAIRSQAYLPWRATYGDEGIRTELSNHSYYFAWGGSLIPRLRLEYGEFSLEGSMIVSAYDSIDGLDRFEEEITRVLVLNDTVVEHHLSLGLPSPVEGLGLNLVYEHTRRTSRIDDLREVNNLHELQTRIQYEF